MTPNIDQLGADLGRLLNPYDERDVPVPGFPSGDAVVAWAKTKPHDAMIEALVDVLEFEDVPQQSVAVAALRALDVDVDARRSNDDLHWAVTLPGGEVRRVDPAYRPYRSIVNPPDSLSESIEKASETLVRSMRSLGSSRIVDWSCLPTSQKQLERMNA
jgi:hypothetical protein